MKPRLTTEEIRAIAATQELEYQAAVNKNSVGEREYKDSILTLLKLSQSNNGAGELAAQVLLSLYNSTTYQVPVANFGLLDAYNFDAALTAIKGRKFVFEEPHNVIQNGDALFNDLKKRWPDLAK
jgi:hypothetical protein